MFIAKFNKEKYIKYKVLHFIQKNNKNEKRSSKV